MNFFMDIKILTMTLSDLNNIKDILETQFDNFWNEKVLEEELSNGFSKYIVAKFEDEIVGFAGLKIILDEADIMNIVTKKCYRNQGIASLLLENLITMSHKLNLNSINLEVNEANAEAIHLYKKFEFQEIGIRKNYYNDKNAIIMQKKL